MEEERRRIMEERKDGDRKREDLIKEFPKRRAKQRKRKYKIMRERRGK